MIWHFRACIGLLSAGVLIVLSGCTQVIETTPVIPGPLGFAPTCRSTLGAYYLPRALLSLRAVAGETSTSLDQGLDRPLTMIADRDQPLCLDYLSLPTARDVITVQRDPAGLLQGITSDVEDRTPEIAKNLIAIGENLAIAAARSGTLAEKDDKLEVDFDPFAWWELGAVNKALRRFGFCIYVEGYSFPVDSLDPANMLAAGKHWCSLAEPPSHPAPDDFAVLPVPAEASRTGVLYRPNMTHKIVVLRKADPSGRNPWLLYQTKRVEMPNVSPVLSIGVERAMFTRRKTALNFSRGVLTDVVVDKDSELAGFVSIPLALAKAIVDVPGRIVTMRITDTNNQTALLAAQTELVKTAAEYRKVVAPAAVAGAIVTGAADVGRAGRLRTPGETYGGCLNAGGGRECDRLLQDVRRP